MGITLSSRSPAMAYADGRMWVSTFDEVGTRCWVNTVTGQRTYKFIGGKPMATMSQSPGLPSPYAAQPPHPAQPPYAVQSPHAAAQSPHVVAQSPFVAHQSSMPNQHAAPWAETSLGPAPLPAPGYPSPSPPGSAHVGAANPGAIVQYGPPPGYGTGNPPVTPAGNVLAQRLRKYYLRPSSERSWMWKQ